MLVSLISEFRSVEPVPAEVAGHPRAEGDGHVLERRADDLLAERRGIGRAHGVVRGLLGHEGRGLLALDVDRAVGVLRERDPADRRPLPVRRLAVARAARPDERAVEGGDLDQPVRGIDADVDLARLVVDVEGVRVELAFPAGRLQHLAVDEDHVVVEAVERRPHALAVALPPAQGPGREQGGPGGPPHVVAQGLPLGRHAGSLEDRALVGIRLQRDPLVEPQAARAVGPAAQHDRVAAHDALDRRLEGRRLGERRAGGVGLSVGGDVVEVGGLLRERVALRDRAVGPARGLGPAGQRAGTSRSRRKAHTEAGRMAGTGSGSMSGPFGGSRSVPVAANGTTRASAFVLSWDILAPVAVVPPLEARDGPSVPGTRPIRSRSA